MSIDSKQFNRTALHYEEVEEHIRRARRLRSEAVARGARRLAAAISAGARSVRDLIVRALHAQSEKGVGASHFGWSPAASAGGRPTPCRYY